MDRVQINGGEAQVKPGFSDGGLEITLDLVLKGFDGVLVVPVDEASEGVGSL